MNKRIVIIDYGIGNVRSMLNAFQHLGADAKLSSDHDEILNAAGVILPGVGAFEKGMKNLIERNLISIIREYVINGGPFLGICLGMQMLFSESEEFGLNRGLNLIEGRVVKLFNESNCQKRLPHISWAPIKGNNASFWETQLFKGISPDSDFYFVHSFVAKPTNKSNLLASSEYADIAFCAVSGKKNIFGVQFHPEKSGKAGLSLLNNFKNMSYE